MNLKALTELLEQHKEGSLYIMLPSGQFVPDHFHITEIGRVQKTFIDCGGTRRENITCSLQVWTAHDIEHRLTAGKLAKILKLAEDFIDNDLAVEIEYGVDVASQYNLFDIEITPKGLLFVLQGKQTDCLAPDKCGINTCCSGAQSC